MAQNEWGAGAGAGSGSGVGARDMAAIWLKRGGRQKGFAHSHGPVYGYSRRRALGKRKTRK